MYEYILGGLQCFFSQTLLNRSSVLELASSNVLKNISNVIESLGNFSYNFVDLRLRKRCLSKYQTNARLEQRLATFVTLQTPSLLNENNKCNCEQNH